MSSLGAQIILLILSRGGSKFLSENACLKFTFLQITLGTGDCCFQYTSTPDPGIYGHALISSLDPNSYIYLNA